MDYTPCNDEQPRATLPADNLTREFEHLSVSQVCPATAEKIGICDLPVEIMFEILKLLGMNEYLELSRVNKGLCCIVRPIIYSIPTVSPT